jgi:hypothetical protein
MACAVTRRLIRVFVLAAFAAGVVAAMRRIYRLAEMTSVKGVTRKARSMADALGDFGSQVRWEATRREDELREMLFTEPAAPPAPRRPAASSRPGGLQPDDASDPLFEF